MAKAAGNLIAWVLMMLLQGMAVTSLAASTTIVFANRGGPVREDLVKYWIADFERTHPDIQVEWEISPGTSAWQDQIVVRTAAGVAPDVLEIYGAFARDWAERGMLLDLAPYVKRDLSSAQLRDFFPHLYQAGILNYGPNKGLQYGLPSYGNISLIYYNKAHFDEAGLTYPDQLDQQGEWTRQTFVGTARKLKRVDSDIVTRWPLNSGDTTSIDRASAWVYSAGGEVFDPQDPTCFLLDRPEAIEGLAFLQDLVWTYGVHVPYTLSELGTQEAFTSGRVSMRLEGTSRITRFAEEIDGQFDFDIALRPVGPVARVHTTSFDAFAISSTSKHPEEAWKMVKYLVTRPGVIPHMRILGRGPAILSVYNEYLKIHPDKNLVAHMQAAQEARVSPSQLMVEAKAATTLINNALRVSVVRNEKSVRSAIEEIAESVRALYR